MSGALALCNEALALLAEVKIASFDEPTPLAQACADLVPGTLDAMLAGYPWRFTLRKERLQRLAQVPLTEWSVAHQLPADRIALRGAYDTDAPDAFPLTAYEVYGEALCTHAPDVWAELQFRVDPALWPPVLRLCARHALAADLAVVVLGSGSVAQQHRQAAFGTPQEGGSGGIMAQARQADSQQQPGQRIRRRPLLEARQGSRAMFRRF